MSGVVVCWVGVLAGLAVADPPAERPVERELDELKAKFLRTAPADTAKVYDEGVEEVRRFGVVGRAVKVGDPAPDFTLPGADGKPVALAAARAAGPVVLVWYRGGWCPYCNVQLRGFQRILPALTAAGATVIAVSPELPDRAEDTTARNALGFAVVSDNGNVVARRYRLMYKLPAAVADKFKGRIDLAKLNGDDSNELPLAATYLIDRDGTVRWAFVDADYRKRAEPADVLAAARKLGR